MFTIYPDFLSNKPYNLWSIFLINFPHVMFPLIFSAHYVFSNIFWILITFDKFKYYISLSSLILLFFSFPFPPCFYIYPSFSSSPSHSLYLFLFHCCFIFSFLLYPISLPPPETLKLSRHALTRFTTDNKLQTFPNTCNQIHE